MPTRKQIAEIVKRQFDNTPAGSLIETAWLAVYQVLLWHETFDSQTYLPHIIDADKLRPRKLGLKPNIWAERAANINSFLAQQLASKLDDVHSLCDLLMCSPEYKGRQRQNPLGIGFSELICHILRKFGSENIEYKTEYPARQLFPGVQLQSRSKNPSIDVLALKNGVPVAIITTKWSIRHDRLTDVIDESISYRSAAMRCGLKVPVFFVTNEFDPARLDKVISNEYVEAVVHVCPKLLLDVCGLNGRLTQLKDLPHLVNLTSKW